MIRHALPNSHHSANARQDMDSSVTVGTDQSAGDDAWQMPEHLSLLRDTVRRFMTDVVRPIEEKQPHDCFALPAPDLDALQARARELGLWCLASPAAYGGGGLSLFGQVVVAEEAAKCRMGA